MAVGDIGELFPDTEVVHQGRDSAEMLQTCYVALEKWPEAVAVIAARVDAATEATDESTDAAETASDDATPATTDQTEVPEVTPEANVADQPAADSASPRRSRARCCSWRPTPPATLPGRISRVTVD